MILSICDDPDILSIMRIIIIVINIIRIITPIILIIVGMTIFTKSVINDEEIPIKQFVQKIIAALLIFFIPTFVALLVDIIDTKDIYYSCIKNANEEKIQEGYVARAESYILNAKNSLNLGYYQLAKSKVSSLKSSGEKERLTKELDNLYQEILKAEEERKEKEKQGLAGIIRPDGKYSKVDIIAMQEDTVRDMTNQEFIEFMASAARIVYSEYGGVLPSITIAQAVLESGWGNSFEDTSHNVFGLIGYPGTKPKVHLLRQFDNFYEATYYHYAYFPNYMNVYANFLKACERHDPIAAADYLSAYAEGSVTYPGKIKSLINDYNLTQYDY